MVTKFLLPVEIYRHEIYFIIGKLEECVKIICKDLGVPAESFDGFVTEHNGGATICFDEGIILVWIQQQPKKHLKYVLTHEINHACNFILRNVGIEHSIETEEAYTYLKTYVEEKVDDILDTHKKIEKKKRAKKLAAKALKKTKANT